VLVVAHGGTLRVLRAYLNGVPVEEMSWEPLENTAVLRIPDFATKSQAGWFVPTGKRGI
jgi:broad specificity phosphatase PhoE